MKRPTNSERYRYWRRVGIDILATDLRFVSTVAIIKGDALDEFTDERIEDDRKRFQGKTGRSKRKRTRGTRRDSSSSISNRNINH